VLALGLALGACHDQPEPPVVLVVAGDSIVLPEGARIHDIDVRVREQGEFEPAAVNARAGDVLRFTVGDGRGHALAFEGDAAGELLGFLEESGQRRGPPLLSAGALWIVTLAEAPPGSVRVVCVTHGESARLTLDSPLP
jgi:plastocyanin